jgi:hypothetical protein
MKNANVFVDVDLTRVDANGRLLDGAIEALNRLKEKAATSFFGRQTGQIMPGESRHCME